MSWVKWNHNDLILEVKIQAGAKKSELNGIFNSRLRIKIAAPPREGKANDEIVVFLSKQFSVKKRDIEFLQGEKSSQKTLVIHGVTKDAWQKFLEGLGKVVDV